MKALTQEQIQAIEVLKELSGRDSHTIFFSARYVEIPKEWFMATYKPEEAMQELFIDNPDGDELHVMRAAANSMTFEAVLDHRDYEQWVKKWEGQTNG